jgi:hypothetical protein
MPITVKYPDDDKINAEQTAYIKNYIHDFEEALFSDDFADPEIGYRKYFDVDAYINYLLVNEIIANPDAFWSTYFLKKRNGKLEAGPVWDFDLAGNYDFVAGDMTKKMVVYNSHRHRMWIERLMEDATFRQAMRKRWNEIKADVITIPQYIDELSKQLKHTQKRNFEKWPIFYIRTHLEWVFPGSFEGEVSFLRKFLVDHIKWLDTHFQSEKFD